MKLTVICAGAHGEYSRVYTERSAIVTEIDKAGNLNVAFKQGTKSKPLGCHVAGFWRHYLIEGP